MAIVLKRTAFPATSAFIRFHSSNIPISAAGIGAAMSASTKNVTDSRVVVNRLSMDEVGPAAELFSRAFPLSGEHSWSRALGMDRTLDGYMASKLTDSIESPTYGVLAARLKQDDETKMNLVGCLILEFTESPMVSHDEGNDVDGDKTEGEATNEDKHQPDEKTMNAYLAIGGIMGECRSIVNRELQERHGNDAAGMKLGYVAWIAVDEACRGNGLASALIRDCNKVFLASGCNYAVAFTMSPTATLVFQKNGFERWGHITYADYELNGKRPFGILPDELSVMVCDFLRH